MTLGSLGNMEINTTLESNANLSAIVNTLANGKSTLKFNDNGTQRLVLTDGVYFAPDSNLTIKDNGDGRMKLESILPLDQNMKF